MRFCCDIVLLTLQTWYEADSVSICHMESKDYLMDGLVFSTPLLSQRNPSCYHCDEHDKSANSAAECNSPLHEAEACEQQREHAAQLTVCRHSVLHLVWRAGTHSRLNTGYTTQQTSITGKYIGLDTHVVHCLPEMCRKTGKIVMTTPFQLRNRKTDKLLPFNQQLNTINIYTIQITIWNTDHAYKNIKDFSHSECQSTY